MAILTLFLVIACLFDYTKRRIPNFLIILMTITDIGMRYAENGMLSCVLSVAMTMIVMALLYPLFKVGVLGAGDVKLFGVCAGYLSPHKILFFFFFSFLSAAIISLLKMWKEQNAIERFQYLCQYIVAAVSNGNLQLYMRDDEEKKAGSICLAGPVLCSVLMCWGGIY